MHIWLINPFDNLPMEGNRPQRYWLMARAFVRAGHTVVYWTSDFSHATKRKRKFVNENEDTFQVRMLPTLAYPKNICLKRVVSHGRLAKEWLRTADEETDVPDVVIASTPPLGLCDAARRFSQSVGAMFIADIQDAWPETFERVLPRFVFSILGVRRRAKRIYLGADGISGVARRYIDLALGYGSDSPMMVFGHCIQPSHQARQEWHVDANLRLAYIGNMSLSYDLATVIRAVKGMDGVTLDIAGNGPDRQRLMAIAEGNPKIVFHGYLDEPSLEVMLEKCDVGLIPMYPDSCVGVPGKLADYAAAELKIIESLGGETGELIDRYCVGEHYLCGDADSLRKAINSTMRLVNKPNHAGFAKEFDASEIMGRYVEWIEGLFRCRKEWGSTRGPHADPLLRN